MDAVGDYIVSHATNPIRVGMCLFIVVGWLVAIFGRSKKADRCTARAVGTIVSAKDEKWSIWGKGFFGTEETPMRNVTIRFSIGGRDMTVTDKVPVPARVGGIQIGSDEGYRGKRLGDKVAIFYNPGNPSEHLLEYGGPSAPISPLMHAFLILFVVAFLLFVPISDGF